MHPKEIILKELVKRGHSKENGVKVWDVSDSKLWYMTPELSEGFLNITKYEPYKKNVVEKELTLIKKHAPKIVDMLGLESFNLIDLGCGDGRKAEEFIKSMCKDVQFRYCPVDISQYFINLSTQRVNSLKHNCVKEVKPFVSDFKDADNIIGMLRNGEFQREIILLLGETVSHFDINDLLYHISDAMIPGGFLVIGNGLRVGERFTALEKYKYPLFDKWFIHIMNAIGFKEDEVEYDARFAHNRLEGYYRTKVDKEVVHNGKKIKFSKGDEIIVATQYKFYEDELINFCKMYFTDVNLIKEDNEYCLVVCKK